MDPQARMLLEHTHEGLSVLPQAAGSSVGVFVGCMYTGECVFVWGGAGAPAARTWTFGPASCAPRCTEYLDGMLAPSGSADNNSNAIVGHGLSFLVGRVSYTFGLQVGVWGQKEGGSREATSSIRSPRVRPPLPSRTQGPCVSTDTACSSSLVALHMARTSIERGEAAGGAAGGVNVMLIPQASTPLLSMRQQR